MILNRGPPASEELTSSHLKTGRFPRACFLLSRLRLVGAADHSPNVECSLGDTSLLVVAYIHS
jgi:hypothetical protein